MPKMTWPWSLACFSQRKTNWCYHHWSRAESASNKVANEAPELRALFRSHQSLDLSMRFARVFFTKAPSLMKIQRQMLKLSIACFFRLLKFVKRQSSCFPVRKSASAAQAGPCCHRTSSCCNKFETWQHGLAWAVLAILEPGNIMTNY